MLWAEFILAAALRIVLLATYENDPPIEFAGPTASHSRVVEALFLKEHHHSIYEGNLFHQPPLVFLWFWLLNSTKSFALLRAVPIIIDLIIAFLIYDITLKNRLSRFPLALSIPDRKSTLNDDTGLESIAVRLYLFNPLTVLSCVSLSTTSLTHLSVVLSVYLAFNGRPVTSALAISVAVYLNLLNVVLMIPLTVIIFSSQSIIASAVDSDHNNSLQTSGEGKDEPGESIQFSFNCATISFISLFFVFLSFLMLISWASTGSWEWIIHTYQYVFGVKDLTPNIGIFWYFVTEVFPRFRLFFLICFHAQIFVYVLPLSIRLWHNPLFLMYTLLHLIAMLKPYPVFGDYGLVYTLLIMQWGILKRMRSLFPVYVPLIISFAMSNLIWHMWIELGSANANFYYFMSLVSSFSNGLILIEAILAVRQLYTTAEKS